VLILTGNVYVIERAISQDEETIANLRTCQMRGWVEPLHEAVPRASLNPDGSLPKPLRIEGHDTIYRLTDSGWTVINRTHEIAVLGLAITLAGALSGLMAGGVM
jgi:hypothetical protein